MFDLREPHHPLVVAPMAGGPSTPALVSAAIRAGGWGFLAGGYQPVDAMREQIAAVRGDGPVAVNLFVPDAEPIDLAAALAYRQRLLPLSEQMDVELAHPRHDDDHYDDKVEALLDEPVEVVSFTFGCPDGTTVRRVHSVGTAVFVTVTTAEEASTAAAAGADALIVQGPEAGGHRGTFDARTTPATQSLSDLLDEVRARVDVPLVAAGGLSTRTDVANVLSRAAAVQIGTAFLDADEAGTSAVHRAALHDPRFTTTALTRAFSGRYARGLRNAFIDEFGEAAPAAYPAINQITAPLRAAAARAGNTEYLSLWAGTRWRAATAGTAAEIIGRLLS